MANKFGRAVAAVIVLTFVGSIAFWAGRTAFRSESPPVQASDASVLVRVEQQSVGKSLTFNTTVTRPRTVIATNALTGVVTQASSSGTFGNGDVLYTVADIPVRAIKGKIPFYRALTGGISGSDVAQMRAALHSMGYLESGSGKSMDLAAQRAIVRWQRAEGLPPTGWLRMGELVAVPKVPAVLSIDRKIARPGAVLSGGENIVAAATGDPDFTMELQTDQAKQIPSEAKVVVHSGKTIWPAIIANSSTTEDGVNLRLRSPDGGAVCADQCDRLPASDELYLTSDVEVIPAVTGASVPVAAVSTQPDGSTTVTVVDSAGMSSVRRVSVKASQEGIAVIEGVKTGETVQALAVPPDVESPTPSAGR